MYTVTMRHNGHSKRYVFDTAEEAHNQAEYLEAIFVDRTITVRESI